MTTATKWPLKLAACPCDGEYPGCDLCQYLDGRDALLEEIRTAILDEAGDDHIAPLTDLWYDEYGSDEYRPTLDSIIAGTVPA